MKRSDLEQYLQDFLQCKKIKDYAPNGLQVEGKEKIEKITTAVTASQAAIEAAITHRSQALLVHHGYFWKGESSVITGIKKQRLALLLAHEINLLAYHLPLDVHAELGNNALFTQCFSPSLLEAWVSPVENLIWHGKTKPTSIESLRQQISTALGREAMAVGEVSKSITRVAWCTGAAQDFFTQAVHEGAEVFISGEYAERTYHEAQELGAAYISCGHHASERAGIKALGEHLAAKFGLEQQFFDEENPF